MSLLPGLPDEILVSSVVKFDRHPDTFLVFPHVERMNLLTARTTREVRNPGKVIHWVVDHAGVVRIGVERDGTRFRILHRADAKARWETLTEYDYKEHGIWPEGFE